MRRSERREDARALLESRWAQIFRFDLDAETWNQLLDQYMPGTLLEALKLSKDCVDPNPERAYAYFLRKLQHASERYEPRSIN